MKLKYYLLAGLLIIGMLVLAQGCANGNGFGPGAHVIFGATS
jgi:hypothetical protein